MIGGRVSIFRNLHSACVGGGTSLFGLFGRSANTARGLGSVRTWQDVGVPLDFAKLKFQYAGGRVANRFDVASSGGTWGNLPATPAASAFANQLRRAGDMVPLPKKALSLADLGSLASSEGAEFAVVRLNGERYLVRGMTNTTTIPEGAKLIGHVHPGEGFMGLSPSVPDIEAFSRLGRTRSALFNESGAWRTYGPNGPSRTVFPPAGGSSWPY
jgi:hypothetical protein